MLLILSAVFCPLMRVAFWEALVLPVATAPNASPEDGESVVSPHPGSLKLEMRVFQTCWDPVWFCVKYSFTYQNVQPSTGSTVILV
jgi:hypothetical protein